MQLDARTRTDVHARVYPASTGCGGSESARALRAAVNARRESADHVRCQSEGALCKGISRPDMHMSRSVVMATRRPLERVMRMWGATLKLQISWLCHRPRILSAL